MGRRITLAAIAVIAVAAGVFALTRYNTARAYQPSDLPEIEARVRQDYSGVVQLAPEQFAAMRTASAPVVVDVREPDEFAVSHISGAVRVDPNVSVDRFIESFAVPAAGRDVVLYCSVGVRSSRLAESVAKALQSRGSGRVYNLEGGLFRWHNEQRELVDSRGPTDRIHPYDSHWGGLVARQDRIATTPR